MDLVIPEGEGKKTSQLHELYIGRVDLVKKPATGKVFTIIKAEDAVVTCSNCGATYEVKAISEVAKNLPKGLDFTCACGERIKIEAPADSAGGTENADKNKGKNDGDKGTKNSQEAADEATEKAIQGLAAMKTENDSLKSKVKELETKISERDNQLKETKTKIDALQSENRELEELATKAMDEVDKATALVAGGKESGSGDGS